MNEQPDNKNTGKDPSKELYGAVYAPFIDPQIAAIAALNSILDSLITDGAGLIMSYEHDGTLLAHQMGAHRRTPDRFMTFPRPETHDLFDAEGERIPVLKEYYPQTIVLYSKVRDLQFTDTVHKYMSQHWSRKFTIVLIDNFRTGKTMEDLSMLMKPLLDTYAMLHFHALLLQETIGHEQPIDVDTHLVKHAQLWEHAGAGRFKVDYRRVPSILGAGIDFQSEIGHKDEKKPVVIFGEVNGELYSLAVTPGDKGTARDVIIDLAKGMYKGKLGNLH